MARFLVMGCGAIGGLTSALLRESGQDVVSFTTNTKIAEALRKNGFRLRGDDARSIPASVVTSIPEEPFDYVLLCTQPPQVEEAARMALPALREDGVMVVFQNGLCEQRVAPIVGDARTIGAVVAWGAAMVEPGVYDRTAHGGYAIGTLDGSAHEKLPELAAALEAIGPAEITKNLAGKRWSKLALNAAISSLGTLGGDRLGPLIQQRFVRRLGLEIMTETVQSARKSGVKLEKVAGTIDLEWVALTEEERKSTGSASLVAKHSLLLAVGFRYRRMRSSMLSAIERGRTPAVDFLNGEVIDHGRRQGVPTPVNEAVSEAVWAFSRGEKIAGLPLLKEVYDATAQYR